ncbi:hypothetical protein F5Y17DRAFT_414049 [Xylariaceae sp. FL0594]|nr:hypothetical protein F5Y17DRAFT_414049 [Xylariaceae sp. FL0594]
MLGLGEEALAEEAAAMTSEATEQPPAPESASAVAPTMPATTDNDTTRGPAPSTAPAPTSATTEAGTRGTKRKVAETTTPEEDEEERVLAEYKKDLDSLIPVQTFAGEPNPDMAIEEVRQRVRNLLDAEIATQHEFAKMLNCSSSSLSWWLSFEGGLGRPTKRGGSIFHSAYAWIRQREVAGCKVPERLKRVAPYVPLDPKKKNSTLNGGSRSYVRTRRTSSHRDIIQAEMNCIILDGQEDDSVEIYDSCDEVRRKIEEYLSPANNPGLTPTRFCRDLAQMLAPAADGSVRRVGHSQLAHFRSYRGARSGAKNIVFYAAYVFFEKLRIR